MTPLDSRIRTGSYPRGEDTRRRIIEAALSIFAHEGYEGASTRQIAEEAGVNLPALSYYFGSKEGLYGAVIAEIVETLETHMAPAVALVEAALRAKPKPRKAAMVDLLCVLLTDFISLITNDDMNPENKRLFFARTEVEDGRLIAPLHAAVNRILTEPVTALVAHLLDKPAQDEEMMMRGVALVGQIVVFCKSGFKRMLGYSDFTPARIEAIKTIVRENVRGIFHAVGESA